jgi:hypothetical protein
MSKQTAAMRKFRNILISEGATPELVDRLLTLADRHQVLETIATNENVGDKFKQEGQELVRALRACIQGPIVGMHLHGDPRGAAVKVVLKSGRWNTLGGKEDGWAVPTPKHTAADIERHARREAKRWSEEQTWSVVYEARRQGAIGIFDTQQRTVSAVDKETARAAAREQLNAEGYETRNPVSIKQI